MLAMGGWTSYIDALTAQADGSTRRSTMQFDMAEGLLRGEPNRLAAPP
jgi:hypothetical protein